VRSVSGRVKGIFKEKKGKWKLRKTDSNMEKRNGNGNDGDSNGSRKLQQEEGDNRDVNGKDNEEVDLGMEMKGKSETGSETVVF
jgi:hypothetical protein